MYWPCEVFLYICVLAGVLLCITTKIYNVINAILALIGNVKILFYFIPA